MNISKKFSILTQSFKNRELRTVEDLLEIMSEAPMNPKQEVQELRYVWDWKAWAEKNFSDRRLKNHSFYNGFTIKRQAE